MIAATRIRTYPHICISAAKDSIHDLPPLDLLQTEEEREGGGGGDGSTGLETGKKSSSQTNSSRRECESNCWASNAMDVVLESLRDALPKVSREHVVTPTTAGPQVINSGTSLDDLLSFLLSLPTNWLTD